MTTTTYVYSNTFYPTANICIGKNRIKQYGNVVYLKDNQEFVIELFNPKTAPVLAKIKLNGSYISTKGIYLKPGERVYLDRFIDTPTKFLFSTYNVDGDNGDVARAIALNGDVEIEFFDELAKVNYQPTWINTTILNGIPTTFTYANNTITDSLNCYYSNTSGGSTPTLSSVKRSTSVETGRVESGSNSSQKFETVSGDFSSFYSSNIKWKILPESQEPVQVSKITAKYCGACGSKIQKPNYKYCPNCGEKL